MVKLNMNVHSPCACCETMECLEAGEALPEFVYPLVVRISALVCQTASCLFVGLQCGLKAARSGCNWAYFLRA